jgi:hypothetical protein
VEPEAEKEVPAWQFEIENHSGNVNQFLRAKELIKEGQTWRDVEDKVLARIERDPVAFLKAVTDWMEAQQ